MSRKLSPEIMHGLRFYDDYFNLKRDAIGKLGFTSYQKCTATIRMLRVSIDLVDKYIRMSESTCLD
jgi:hypothetical protein